ncbi:ABC-type transport auxiliary lipoprotein family protein [Halopseudomonas salegens]|uniref:Cholesterol transport system auxiliary component n=1 Tax=Halopseudomonas salegens TaxID=1434072 RepID=A0A1H2GT40_9GAMM|nr:ABC-type transport auxiliary lipoprotein family protein [Halopseudomonas salegens]SDU22823.1 cholesterol transport system auxiliary component [Halopseudomonas salegens]
MNRLHRLLPILLATTVLSLNACSILPEAEPINVYQLPDAQVEPLSQPSLPLALRINTPSAGFVHSSPRMLVNPQGNQLSTYKGSRWSDPAPALIRDYLVHAFNGAGLVSDVSTDEQALHADVHLGSELRRFQVVYPDGPIRVVIDFKARLIDPGSRRTLASENFLIEQPLSDPHVASVVEGYGLAAQQLAEQLLAWAARTLEHHQADSPFER